MSTPETELPEVVITASAPTVNVASAVSAARRPRAIVRVNGTPIAQAIPASENAVVLPGWIAWSVVNNSYYEADTFRLSFATSPLPQANDASWFMTQREVYVEIFAGFPADPTNPQVAELQSLIYGRVDDVHYDPVQRTIELTGRDLTAAFIDTKITSQWTNQTASSIAQSLAAAHGLSSVVQPTFTKVGTYYQIDQVHLQANKSEWDLLAYLARQEGFVCYVQGQQLFFQPDPTNQSDPYQIQWQAPASRSGVPVANAVELSFSRSMTIAKGITVEVRSASSKNKTPVVQSYPSAPRGIQPGKSSPFGSVQAYFGTLPRDSSPAQVQKAAKEMYDEIVAHEMKVTARLAGDNLLTIQTPIRVTGTGTAFDQTYFPREITRMMSLDEGYEMTVEAQNVNPDTAPAS